MKGQKPHISIDPAPSQHDGIQHNHMRNYHKQYEIKIDRVHLVSFEAMCRMSSPVNFSIFLTSCACSVRYKRHCNHISNTHTVKLHTRIKSHWIGREDHTKKQKPPKEECLYRN